MCHLGTDRQQTKYQRFRAFLAIQQISMIKNPSKMVKEAVSISFKRTFKFGITRHDL
jgi:hypothetical protein